MAARPLRVRGHHGRAARVRVGGAHRRPLGLALDEDRIIHSPDLINPDQPPFWRFAGNERFRFHEDNLRQVYDLEWDYLSGSHGNIGIRADIDFEFAFIADLKAAIGKAMSEHPFTEFVTRHAKAHTEFLSKFFSIIATEATKTLRPKYGRCTASKKRRRPTPRWSRGRCSSTADERHRHARPGRGAVR